MTEPLFVDIAILGGGFSGTLVAAHLLSKAPRPLRIALIEKDSIRWGRGVAYATPRPCHVLNVPAGNMSAFPDDPGHFLRWAESQAQRLNGAAWAQNLCAQSFLPRYLYGDYLCSLLEQAQAAAAPGVVLEKVIAEAVGIDCSERAVEIRLSQGGTVAAARAALALGNFRPASPAVADPSFYRSQRYIGDPWSPRALADLPADAACLLIGTGLTMVDLVIALKEQHHRGPLHALSRRGLWPQSHQAYTPYSLDLQVTNLPRRVSLLFGRIREKIRAAAEDQRDWRAVIDALRPYNQALWASLDLTEQRRFLRHVRAYWDCHRHRLAPPIAAQLDELVQSGQLIAHAGRIEAFHEDAQGVNVRIGTRSDNEFIRVARVINCTGPECNYKKLDHPLIQGLFKRGLARPDPLSFGLDTAYDGALIDQAGRRSAFLYTLGPSRKGLLWETTAVPEIRVQALELALRLLADLGLLASPSKPPPRLLFAANHNAPADA